MFTKNDKDQQAPAATLQGTPNPPTGQLAVTAPVAGGDPVTTQPLPAAQDAAQNTATATGTVTLPRKIFTGLIKKLQPKALIALRKAGSEVQLLVDETLKDYIHNLQFVNISGTPVDISGHTVDSLLDAWKHHVIMPVATYNKIASRSLSF